MSNQITVNRWHREQVMDRVAIVTLQILVYCHLAGIGLTDKELKCLTYIGLRGQPELRHLCNELVTPELYTSSDSVRGALDRLLEKKVLEKDGKNRKTVFLAPIMSIQTEGNIMVDIKCLCRQ